MEKQELVSVIIPVYNVEKYLKGCIDSVLHQTYTNFEIILVDDGSTDTSGKICDEYGKLDKRIRVIHQKNAGASAARNAGLKVISGEYVYFLDSDDWLENTAFEKIVECIAAKRANFIFFDAYTVDEESGNISKKHYSHKKIYKSGKGHEIMKELLANKEFHVAPWSMFFRKDFLIQFQICFKEGIIYEDMIFAYQIFCMASKVSYLPEYLYFRRYRENSVMTSKVSKRNFESALEVYYQVTAYTEKLPDDIKCSSYIVRCAYNVLNVYERLESKDKRVFYDTYRILKKDILVNKAYGDTALKLRCYGKIWWFIYKALLRLNQGFNIGAKR